MSIHAGAAVDAELENATVRCGPPGPGTPTPTPTATPEPPNGGEELPEFVMEVEGVDGCTTGTSTPAPGSGPGYGQPLPRKVTPLAPTPTLPVVPAATLLIAGTGVTTSPVSGGVQIRPLVLSSVTPTPKPLRPINLDLTIYYDANNNKAPDMSEGVAGVSVRVLDAATNRLLAQTFTDSQGHASLSLSVPGEVRLSVSYLSYNKPIKPPGGVFTIRLPALRIPSLIP